MLGEEVVQGRHHAVAGSTAVDCVVELGVDPSLGEDAVVAWSDPGTCVRMAVFVGDLRRLVVQIPVPVGPADIVEHEHGHHSVRPPRSAAELAQFVHDGVPVVVAVDQRDVEGREVGQHVEAQCAMEDVATRELRFVFGGIELRQRIDDVELAVGAELIEHQRRGLTTQRADLEDPLAVGCLHDRRDHRMPEREHVSSSIPLALGVGAVTLPTAAGHHRTWVPSAPPGREGVACTSRQRTSRVRRSASSVRTRSRLA